MKGGLSIRETSCRRGASGRGVDQHLPSDELIYSRFLAEHNEEDFRILLDRHRESLMLFIYSFVHNMDDAEELMLDAFAEAAAGAKFSGRSSFKTWLFTIARNIAYNYVKRYRSRMSDQPIEDHITLSDGTDLEKEYLKTQRNIDLHEAMKKLNPDYFQVLYLMYFEDLDTEEIASIMHRSKRQIGDLVYRSKKSLKSILEKAGFQYEDF